jgi:hypothetical protein
MGKKKKLRPRKTFVDGIDSYGDEYDYWKKTTIIKRLVGVFEVPEAEFEKPIDELLGVVGLDGYTVVKYTADHDNKVTNDKPSSGAGCAVAIRDVYGKIAPAVFVKSEVVSVSKVTGEVSTEVHPQFDATVRLLLLLHELGHANDISRAINYDHTNLKIDLAAAEAYAHEFVCKQAQKNNYTLALHLYLENVDRMAKSELVAERVGAELFLNTRDVAGIRDWIAERRSPAGRKRFLEQSGRAEEIHRRNKRTEN